MELVESAKGNEKQVQENSFQKMHFKKAAVGAWPGGLKQKDHCRL